MLIELPGKPFFGLSKMISTVSACRSKKAVQRVYSLSLPDRQIEYLGSLVSPKILKMSSLVLGACKQMRRSSCYVS